MQTGFCAIVRPLPARRLPGSEMRPSGANEYNAVQAASDHQYADCRQVAPHSCAKVIEEKNIRVRMDPLHRNTGHNAASLQNPDSDARNSSYP
jgi:hypothetical protein